KKIEARNATTLVAAHNLLASATMPADAEPTFRAALERVVAEGRRLHDAKVAVDGAPASADFGPYAGWWRRADNAAGALKRVYMELDGQLKVSDTSDTVRQLWAQRKPVFGIYAPNENAGARGSGPRRAVTIRT